MQVVHADERGKASVPESKAVEARAECDRLWESLQAEARVLEDGRTALAVRGQELDTARAVLQGLVTSAQEACDALLPHPAQEGPVDLTGQVCLLVTHIPQVVRCTVCQGAVAALTLARLQLP